MSVSIRLAIFAMIAALWTGAGAAPAEAAGKYQLMKATDNRVWRLNTETGEIAVCTLNGERLICTSSSEASRPPPRSYAEIKAAEQKAQAVAEERREKKEAQDLAMLERFLAFFKEIIDMAKQEVDVQ